MNRVTREIIASIPFTCEWCDSPLKATAIRDDEDEGRIYGIGPCPKCNTQTWSKPLDRVLWGIGRPANNLPCSGRT
jgi:ssDNA-binding Zn-finger/Zn-ribbon topoisomerase 1